MICYDKVLLQKACFQVAATTGIPLANAFSTMICYDKVLLQKARFQVAATTGIPLANAFSTITDASTTIIIASIAPRCTSATWSNFLLWGQNGDCHQYNP